ncbi:MAG: tol-pal system protein YbgF [Alphaproteobacteria bacterium]|nr:tol-pal system protein YbgF [Alphaproteobacteria bacterium]MDA8006165.1 tol-pal system protein YbgF [Alphaproteobacteria bacterium]MDA8013542.1 tol-pal system protein YbgF [Alphaproteobacteria bacterium]
MSGYRESLKFSLTNAKYRAPIDSLSSSVLKETTKGAARFCRPAFVAVFVVAVFVPDIARAQETDAAQVLRSRLETLENKVAELQRSAAQPPTADTSTSSADNTSALAAAETLAARIDILERSIASLRAAQANRAADNDADTAAAVADASALAGEISAEAAAREEETRAIRARLFTLEEQLATLAVPDDPAATDPNAADPNASAAADTPPSIEGDLRPFVRQLGEMELLLANLTGRVEELSFRVAQLEKDAAEFSAAPPGEPVVETSVDGGEVRTLGTISATTLEESDESLSGIRAGETSATATATTELAALPAAPQTAATPREQYDRAFALLRGTQYAEAEAELRLFLERWPDDALAPNARYWLGETLYVRKDYQAAARVFAEGVDQDPEGPKTPDNLLKLGLSFASLDETDKACQILANLSLRYEDAPETILRRAEVEQSRIGCAP